MSYRIDKNKLVIGEISISLPFPIKKALFKNSSFFILIDDGLNHSYGDNSLDRNIYAFTKNGVQLWQIQSCPFGDIKRPRRYVDIEFDGDQLIAYNWLGVYCRVDLTQGTVTSCKTEKRPW